MRGGPCNDPAAACYSCTARGGKRYELPSKVIKQIKALRPGQWHTVPPRRLPVSWACPGPGLPASQRG